MLVTSVREAVAILSILLVGQVFGQEPSYYWNDEETTTASDETTTMASTHPQIFRITVYDENLTPVFVVNSEICNTPRAVVFPLKSTAVNINYTIEKGETNCYSFLCCRLSGFFVMGYSDERTQPFYNRCQTTNHITRQSKLQ